MTRTAPYLSSVCLLSIQNPFGSHFNVDILVNNAWTFTTELESDRRDVLRSGSSHDTTHSVAAGIEDMVPAESEQSRRRFLRAVHNDVGVLIEVPREEISE